MNEQNHDPGWLNGQPGWVDGQRFNENRNRVPAEELAKWAGMYVAWSLDGTHILAGGLDEKTAEEQLKQSGISPREVVWSYVPGSGEDTWL